MKYEITLKQLTAWYGTHEVKFVIESDHEITSDKLYKDIKRKIKKVSKGAVVSVGITVYIDKL